METTNLSKIRRDKMLNTINEIKKNIVDEETLTNLSMIENELTKKKYGLIWEEHEERVDKELETQIPTFEEVKGKEIISNHDDKFNFLLEGDNLHSLYLLKKTHKGKIDVIYIDPPYNTGNKDFMYNDCHIDSEDSYKHSKWLSFMKRRLEIANELLSDKGTIFISIDDNEFAQLKLLCDDIFGENDFVTSIHWKRSESQNNSAKQLAIVVEYILCYAKDKFNHPFNKIDLKETALKEYRYTDELTGKKFRRGTIVDNTRGKNILEIVSPNGIKKTIKSIRNKEFFDKKNKNGEIYWTETGTPYLKIYLDNSQGQVANNWFDNVGVNEDAADDLRKMKIDFSFSKPSSLIKQLLKISSKQDSIVLDFFAGSGTTAQAVLELNKEDKGTRKFILGTNNESNICENATYKRLKYINNCSGTKNVSFNLKYYKCTYIHRINTEQENLHNNLLINIKNLIQLENGIEIDDNKIRVYLNESELDKFSANEKELEICDKVYISSDILLTLEQEKIFEDNNIEVYIIPEYYFEDEIMEVM